MLYLCQITEALVYALADAFGLKSQFPLNANLVRIGQSQASILNRLSEAMAKAEMKGVEIAAMQKLLKELVKAVYFIIGFFGFEWLHHSCCLK